MKESIGSIVIISGPVGAGKSTLAKALVELSPAPVALIEGDEFWKFLVKNDGSPRKGFQTIMASMTAAAIPLAVTGYQVMLDFSIPPWYLERCKAIVSRWEIPLHYVVVMPSQAACASRAAKRQTGQIEDYARYEELYRDFEVVETKICDDQADPDTLAKRVREEIDAGGFRV